MVLPLVPQLSHCCQLVPPLALGASEMVIKMERRCDQLKPCTGHSGAEESSSGDRVPQQPGRLIV